MLTTEVKAYTLEQLASAEKMFKALSELSEDKQCTAVMVANAFIEGMKAQERSLPTTEGQCATRSTYANRSIRPA